MEWLGYTTHDLWGNISIVIFILLLWWVKNIDPIREKRSDFVVMIVLVIGFVLTFAYVQFLIENPSEVVILF